MTSIRQYITLVIFNSLAATCLAQVELLPFSLSNMERSDLRFKIDTLTDIQFTNLTNDLSKEIPDYNSRNHIDTLKRLLPKAEIIDSCIIIHQGNDQLTLCNKKGADSNGNSLFKLLDSKCEYVIIEESGYEWWNYIIVNSKDGSYFQFRDAPIFVNCDIAYSAGNYYGAGQFVIHNLITQNKLEFDSYNWTLRECFRRKNIFYFMFSREFNTNDSIYLKLEIADGNGW